MGDILQSSILKFNNYINEALEVILLFKLRLYQQIKWHFLFFKILAMLTKCGDVKQEKYNSIFVHESQIFKEKKLVHQITFIFNLQAEYEAANKNMFIQDLDLQADWC
jgi:hypothetical protein